MKNKKTNNKALFQVFTDLILNKIYKPLKENYAWTSHCVRFLIEKVTFRLSLTICNNFHTKKCRYNSIY